MDPITLFALANGAVSAVKAGCKLYKDIKGAAGDVKDILKDLEQQYNQRFPPNHPPTVAERNQYVTERNRVIELNKKSGETTNIYQEIGNHLGIYYDNFHKCMAIFEEEERRSKQEVYTGEDSLGKRALQRVLMKKQLIQMETELRELMIYQSPTELGALYTEVEEMMKIMSKEQKILVAKQMQKKARDDLRRAARKKAHIEQFLVGMIIILGIFVMFYIFAVIIDYRIKRWPDLGNCAMPKGTWLYKEWTKLVWATCE